MKKIFQKKAQITLFIIIGIMIILAVAFVFYISSRQNSLPADENNLIDSVQLQPITNYIEQCLKNTAEKAVSTVSYQGGYFIVPEPKIETITAAFHIYNNQSLFPTKEKIQEQIALYIEQNIYLCLNSFADFKEKGYSIEDQIIGEKRISAKVILASAISINLNYPIKIEKQNQNYLIRDFSIVLPIDYRQVYDTISLIHLKLKEDTTVVPISSLAELSKENKFNFQLSYPKNDIVVYTILFSLKDEDKQNENKLIFIFAAKYNWEYLQQNNYKLSDLK